MRNLLIFGLAGWFLLILLGCAHTSDSTGSMPKQQESTAAQTNGTLHQTAAAQPAGPRFWESR